VPVEQIVTVEQIVPVTETVYVTEVVPVEQIVTVEQIVPVTETVYVTEVVPVEQIVTVEQIVPVTETVYVTEVVSVEQLVPITFTVYVTETVPAPPTPQPLSATDRISVTTDAGTGQAHDVASDQSASLRDWSQLLPSYDAPSPLPVTGLAMYYAPDVMAQVEAYRERVNNLDECAECVGKVALLRAGDLGRKVWIKVGDGQVEGPFQVVDVAARHHIPELLRRNWVVDVDYATAMRWGMRGPMTVTVYGEAPTDTASIGASDGVKPQ
ncbi:MAG TPA: hypothetical protein GYA08_26465, partial [Chloroflexi bacterium]|nr:hypothetical protein [Chloroflexota bacterium]